MESRIIEPTLTIYIFYIVNPDGESPFFRDLKEIAELYGICDITAFNKDDVHSLYKIGVPISNECKIDLRGRNLTKDSEVMIIWIRGEDSTDFYTLYQEGNKIISKLKNSGKDDKSYIGITYLFNYLTPEENLKEDYPFYKLNPFSFLSKCIHDKARFNHYGNLYTLGVNADGYLDKYLLSAPEEYKKKVNGFIFFDFAEIELFRHKLMLFYRDFNEIKPKLVKDISFLKSQVEDLEAINNRTKTFEDKIKKAQFIEKRIKSIFIKLDRFIKFTIEPNLHNFFHKKRELERRMELLETKNNLFEVIGEVLQSKKKEIENFVSVYNPIIDEYKRKLRHCEQKLDSFISKNRITEEPIIKSIPQSNMNMHKRISHNREKVLNEKRQHLIKFAKEINQIICKNSKYSFVVSERTSFEMLDVLDRVEKISKSDVNVFIYGETGTGKELIASAIHYLSPRREAPFVPFNCAGVQDTLLESELFGYEKGAFTGATEQKKGLFEIANGGTIFLDEVGDLSPVNQAKILRFLQDKINRRVGGTKEFPVDVRIISATNKNLEDAIKKGDFREDLYERLRSFDIYIPPLRDRKEDIPLIIEHLIKKFQKELDSDIQIELTKQQIESLKNYRWSSNIREVENVVRRWLLLGEIDLDFLSIEEENTLHTKITPKGLEDAKKEFEKICITKALKQSNGVITLAAKKLNISTKKMYRKLEQYNLNSYLDKIRNSQK